MRLLCLLLLFAACTMAQANDKIYKSVDENGNVVYTNDPKDEQAEEIQLPELGVVEGGEKADLSMEAARRAQERSKARNRSAANKKPYQSMSITSPAEEESIWGTGGNLAVTVNAGEELAPGHRIQVFLDGAEIPRGKDGSFRIDEVHRGEHKITARVVDGAGNVLAKTGPRIFFMKQASVINPGSGL